MAMKMNDFLLEYYKRLIFRDMSPEQFSQYNDYVKADDFNGDMKKWKDLLQTNPAGELITDPATKLYVPKDMLTDADLEPADLEKLFRAFQNAFRNMDGNRKSFANNTDATNFLNQYFGVDNSTTPPTPRMFDFATANTRAESLIGSATAAPGTLLYFLENKRNELKFSFQQWGVINDDFTYDDLLDGIRKQKYNSNAKFQKSLLDIVDNIIYRSENDDFLKSLKLRPGERIPQFNDILNGFDDNVINPYQLNNFKLSYDNILRALYSKPKIYDVFKEYDEGKISKQIDKAKEFLDYNNPESKNYVKPKREDALTLPQQISKFVGDTYNDYLSKYVKFTGDRFYFSDSAQAIINGLTKAKVKPTDGISGIIKASGDVKSKLQNAGKFTAVNHLDWFTKTMSEFEKDSNISKIFAGAFKNGTHMRALIREVIFKAVREGKKNEAKTAMEILSVCRYGYTTSKIMDMLGNETLTLFSDGKLSWNKNEAMQFITKALDSGLKTLFKGVGKGITIAGNAIRLSGSKIHKTTGALNTERKTRLQNNEDARNNLGIQIANEQSQIINLNATIGAHSTAGRTTTSLNNEITNAQSAIDAAQISLETASRQLELWMSANDTHPEYALAEEIYNDIYTGTPTALAPTEPALLHIYNTVQKALNDINTNTTKRTDANTYLTDLTNAQTTLSAISAQLTKHQDEYRRDNWDANHPDEVEELVNYWNMLESGRGTHTGLMYSWVGSRKSREKTFKANRDAIIQMAQKNKIASI